MHFRLLMRVLMKALKVLRRTWFLREHGVDVGHQVSVVEVKIIGE